MSEADLVHPVPFEPRPLRLGDPRPPGRRRLPKGPLIALGVLLVLAAALASLRAVEIQVEPSPDRIHVGGLPLGVAGLRLFAPGPHGLRAEKAGYRTLDTTFEVTRDVRQVARFRMERLPSLLALELSPATGVRVFVDGAERGATPIEPLELVAGAHDVALQAEGYKSYTTRVSAQGGGDTIVVRATLTPDRAPVRFASDPAGAEVRVDGAAVGTTPLSIDLTSGVRKVEVSLPGYRPVSRTIAVVAEQPLVVPAFRLEALPGRLSVTSDPPGALVSVDGAFRGEAPLGVDVVAGRSHVVRATKAGHEAAEATVTLARGESQSLALRLAAQQGELQVVGEPGDAEVFVDGESRGPLNATLRLSAAPHEIEVRRSGYESQRASVTPRPGFPETLRVKLRSQSETAAVARPATLRAAGHELRLLGSGRFQMGASRREPGRRANETLREVELARPAYLGLREVTNAEFRRFDSTHASGRFGPQDLDTASLPVVQVTWEQAAAYCNWLSAQERLPPAYVTRDGRLVAAAPLGTGYRLPTEAEWSRAARYAGPGPLRYPWGASLPAPQRAGNFADTSAKALVPIVLQGYDDGYPATAPAGSFPPNALGFYDLAGNVAEWIHDVYSIPPADTPVERDPTGPASGELHVILGSSFLQGSVSELRLSYRDYGTKPRADVGFRIARYAE